MTDTPTLIEAIARAMHAADAWTLNNPEGPRAAAYMPDEFRDMARASLSAIEQAGYVLMPVEPTQEMLAEGRRFAVPATQSISAIYAALLSARPRVT